ncbi:hypothetical protein ADUPG1_007291 [Aduncisulcus paluster]|uniref:HIT-type domain-containing protein n=1 Tax=Aduncisulcus paluster TaxID=2918883 RepID=A0ABQ5KPJ1_9EUKA|nr:hypothetical protein ADUPG1_007291 [Aduncisulcus paluster]
MGKCIICAKASKYKCPNCKEKYCSLDCYKIHQDKCKKVEEIETIHLPLGKTMELLGSEKLLPIIELSAAQKKKLQSNEKISDLLKKKMIRKQLKLFKSIMDSPDYPKLQGIPQKGIKQHLLSSFLVGQSLIVKDLGRLISELMESEYHPPKK